MAEEGGWRRGGGPRARSSRQARLHQVPAVRQAASRQEMGLQPVTHTRTFSVPRPLSAPGERTTVPDSGPLPAQLPCQHHPRRAGQWVRVRAVPLQVLLGLCFLRQLRAGPDGGQQNSGPKAVYSLIPKPVTTRPHVATGPCPWAHMKDPGMRR